ncbi:MAG: nickel/cobalt transporter [Pseudomonadota bacterium]
MRLTDARRPLPLWPWIGLALLLAGLAFLAWSDAAAAWSDRWSLWLVEIQRSLHARLAAALDAVRTGGLGAAWPLVALSFGYGVFHAAGPGHGKIVISTYLATHESRLPPALRLTAAAALAQAVTAIVAVHTAVTLLGFGLRQARTEVDRLESLSFALVALLGALLTGRALRALWRRRRAPDRACASCGHHHPPPVSSTSGGGRWAALGVVASVGLRPCTGAVVVLLLAYAGDLRLVGIVAVLAMAVGTALTTGALASLAVLARRTAVRLVAWLPDGGGRLALALDVAALLGGLVILALGGLLLDASLQPAPPHPFR